MKVGDKTIEYLTGIVTGENKETKYMSGPQLVAYFKNFGFNDQYGQGFPARFIYCMEKIEELNNDDRIELLLEDYYNPINFIEDELRFTILLHEVNKYLYFDDLVLVRRGKKVKLEEKVEEDSEEKNSEEKIIQNDNIISLSISNEMYLHIKEYLENEDYFHAVEEAYKFVREKLRKLTGEEKATDAFRTDNLEKIFGRKPVTQAEKDFCDGVKYINMGIQFLRNQKSHTLAERMNKNLALHYISLASLAYQLITHEI